MCIAFFFESINHKLWTPLKGFRLVIFLCSTLAVSGFAGITSAADSRNPLFFSKLVENQRTWLNSVGDEDHPTVGDGFVQDWVMTRDDGIAGAFPQHKIFLIRSAPCLLK